MKNNYDKYETDVNKYYLDIKFSFDKNKAFNKLEELYRYVKSIQSDYYNRSIINGRFMNISNIIYKSEDLFKDDFIIESSPNFKKDDFGRGFCSQDKDDRLRWIIYQVRRKLSQYYSYSWDNEENLMKASMSDKCAKSSNLVEDYCKDFSINSKRMVIYPGFVKKPSLFNGYNFHYFNIVSIYGKQYIVDLTYRQFFLKDQSSIERIGVFSLLGTLPGSFMIMNDSRMKTALELLKNGYIEMTDENIKNYFDGFAVSFRNGTYYDNTEDYSFTTRYSPYDYLRFIHGYDSQYRHEGEDVLGYQKKVLRKNIIK